MRLERDLNRVLTHIYRATGFDARHYRPSTLARRLNLRLLQTGSRDFREYLTRLRKDASESYSFIHSFLIQVSEFFRDREVFFYLRRRVLPELLRRAAAEPKKRLRIWSIACSRGQEPYSLAMILDELCLKMGVNVTISILATDVSSHVLEEARKGHYSRSEIERVPRRYRKKYFEPSQNDGFKINKRLRKMVQFEHHDIIQDKNPSAFHLVLCRNILIFITAQAQVRLFRKIHASLKKRGILVLGKSESPREEKLFRCLSLENRVYQRVP